MIKQILVIPNISFIMWKKGQKISVDEKVGLKVIYLERVPMSHLPYYFFISFQRLSNKANKEVLKIVRHFHVAFVDGKFNLYRCQH